MSQIDDAIESAKEWLRANVDYNMRIELNGLYGRFDVSGLYRGIKISQSAGMDMGKHINKVLSELIDHKAKNVSDR